MPKKYLFYPQLSDDMFLLTILIKVILNNTFKMLNTRKKTVEHALFHPLHFFLPVFIMLMKAGTSLLYLVAVSISWRSKQIRHAAGLKSADCFETPMQSKPPTALTPLIVLYTKLN